MFLIRKIAMAACLVAITSCSGCCLFSSYGAGGCGGGCAAAPSYGVAGPGCGAAAPSCGLESYGGGCDSCGGGCAGGSPGGCSLGLGCIGKVFGLLSCGGGCGETYYHDWISDPPSCDPCDGCGNWNDGGGAGGYGSCGGGGCSSGGCASGGCLSGGGGCAAAPSCGSPGISYEPACGCAAGPSCGVAAPGCGLAGGGGCGYERTAFQMPGRALYATWSGVGGLFRELRRGFLPSCGTCNAFSVAGNCNSCASADPSCGCGVISDGGCAGGCSGGGDVYFGGAGGGCSTCSHQVVGNQVVHHGGQTIAQTAGRLPHHVVTKQIKVAHGRPPHRVVTDRLRLR